MPTQISRNRGVFQTFMVNSPSPKRLLRHNVSAFTDKNYSKDGLPLMPAQLPAASSSFGTRFRERDSPLMVWTCSRAVGLHSSRSRARRRD